MIIIVISFENLKAYVTSLFTSEITFRFNADSITSPRYYSSSPSIGRLMLSIINDIGRSGEHGGAPFKDKVLLVRWTFCGPHVFVSLNGR